MDRPGLRRVRHRRIDALSRVPWERLESLVAEYYAGQGYRVEHVGTGGTGSRFDGGVDLKLRKGHEYILVQCKGWNAYQVTHNPVHELLGIMLNEGATGAIVVTTGEFTPAAIQAARKQGRVQLVDGDALRAMLGSLDEEGEVQTIVPADLRPPRRSPRSRRDAAAAQSVAAKLLAAGASFTMLLLAIGFALHWLGRPTWQSRAAVESARSPTGTALPSAPAQPRRRQTPAEIRESQRKAEEAMKVIEATTPEI